MKTIQFFLMLLLPVIAGAQYAPQALVSGSTAIFRSSPQFSAWASGCTITRGFQLIGDPTSNLASVGDSSLAIGPADGTVVSLGDSGVAVLRFARPIRNEAGPDFAVFENGFAKTGEPELAFLELAFVEVSSDGVNFTRFPAISRTPDSVQISSVGGMSYISARRLNNLAGKYIGAWGTPFDLAELSGAPGLDINAVTHIRIVDVVGDVASHASFDSEGNIINDPFPTVFPSGGFDLDAVGVLNAVSTGIDSRAAINLRVFPNPATEILNIVSGSAEACSGFITDLSGRRLQEFNLVNGQGSINISGLPAGCFYLQTNNDRGIRCQVPIVRR